MGRKFLTFYFKESPDIVLGGGHTLIRNQHYSPTASLESLRLILAMAQCFNWSLSTVDISTAFLHATLSEDDWQPVVLPPTTVDEAGNRLYLLLTKALYGLRRAPLAWYRELTSTLYKLGFSQTSESIVLRFVKHSAGEFILILLYVDDLLMAGSPSIIKWSIGQLERSFKTNTTGSLGAGVYQRVIYCIVDK